LSITVFSNAWNRKPVASTNLDYSRRSSCSTIPLRSKRLERIETL
jgi:hypothetical protein